jgi:GNAT superfamily N-acetyltransferase
MNRPVSIRLASTTDAGAIHDLTHAAYSKWIAVTGRPPLPMTVDYAQAVREHRFDLLFVGEALAALIETTPDGDQLLIVNVAVHPDVQGRGFGVRLLKLADDLAAGAGLAGTRLYTNKLFEPNIRLYASLGYAIDREEVLERGTVVHMSKALKS